MIAADKLRNENIAEYLLYMWQVEDLLRACDLDIAKVKERLIDCCSVDDATKSVVEEWYANLIEMMRLEDVKEKGHLQINQNIIIQLTDLHLMLLKSPKFPEYTAEFYHVLPIIVELRAKAGNSKCGEIETCFNALYGMLMMRLQKKEISGDTENAMTQISKFVSLLASYYHKDRQQPIFDKEDYQ